MHDWKEAYTTEDGPVERHKGSGSLKEDVIPENFDAFADQLADFIAD